MAACCNYTGTCRACIGNGKTWFSTQNDSNCCAFQPRLCGKSIAHMAETLAECKDSPEHSILITSGAVLATFFIVSIVVIINCVKRGGISSMGRLFTRRHPYGEDEPMIPMVRFSRTDSVYSYGLSDIDL